MKVIILFTYGVSIKDWKSSGLLDREVKIYNHLSEKYGIEYKFLTFGDETDLEYQHEIPNIEIIPLYKYVNKNSIKYFEIIKSFFYPFKIRKILSFENTIIKTNQLWGSWIGIVLKIITKKPLIIRTGYDLLTFKRLEGKGVFKIFLFKTLTKLSLLFSNRYLVTSEQDYKSLNFEFKNRKNKISILSNWVKVDEKINTKRFNNRLISVGRLEKQKNFPELIMQISQSRYELDIYGDGSEKNNLIKLSEENNSIVNFMDRIKNEDLLDALRKYKYFVSSTLYEGNPKAILEAMSAGCVVIVSNAVGVNNIIDHGKNGYIFDFENDNLINFIDNLNEDNLEKVVKRSKQYIKDNHDLNVIALKEKDIYTDLL